MAAGPAQERRTAGRRAKDVAPSTGLRTWYRHDPAKFDEFRRRYTAELGEPGPREAFGRLRALAADGPVTLLTATKDLSLSQAAVPAELRGDLNRASPRNSRTFGRSGRLAGSAPPRRELAVPPPSS